MESRKSRFPGSVECKITECTENSLKKNKSSILFFCLFCMYYILMMYSLVICNNNCHTIRSSTRTYYTFCEINLHSFALF